MVDVNKILNVVISLVPVGNQVVSEVSAVIAAIRAAAAAHGYDADTALIDSRIAESSRRMQVALDEAAASAPKA